MRRDAQKILIAAAAAMLAAGPAFADLTWFNSATSRITYASGGTNYIAGNRTNCSVGCLVQMIFAGANATNDAAINSGTGVTNDDVVVSNIWMGINPSGANGYTLAPTDLINDTNGFYFVRVWTAPALDFTNGLVPTSPTNFYGDSRLFSNPHIEPPGFPPSFDFGGNGGFSTTLSPGITDTDSDGMPDWWESAFFGNPTSVSATADAESDGQDNFAEYVSGTDPTNAASVFQVEVFGGAEAGSAVIQWSSVTGKVYDVRRYTNLLSGYTVQATNLPATPPLNSFTDTTTGVDFYFYGIGVK